MRIFEEICRTLNKKAVFGVLSSVAIGAAIYAPAAMGAVSEEEARQLGDTLTEFGAIKAANADGSIPAYTGGLQSSTLAVSEDPFADEEPLYSITAANMAEYEDMLTDGAKLLLTRHADYRIDVYPTHRTMSYPDWVLENTLKNATTAWLGGDVEGDDLMGEGEDDMPYPGIPFPIPKTGYEVMWNHTAKYVPPLAHIYWSGYLVDTSGKITTLPHLDVWYVHPRYDRTGSLQRVTPERTMFGNNAKLTDPPSSAGIVFLNFYTARGSERGQKVWFYTPGQRRVRLAPEFAYDVPIASYGGVTVWDETYGFVGRLDRFNFKLIGRKEMIVPYNVYLPGPDVPVKEVLGPKFVNPDYLRYEKHRVWVVEATRKDDARHIYSRRKFYIDEDSWTTLVMDTWDDAGKLYRSSQINTNSVPGPMGGVNHYCWTTYDVIKGNYFVLGMLNREGDRVKFYESSEGLNVPLTPAAVQASGVR